MRTLCSRCGRLHDGAVDAHGHVVHEDPPVHPTEVDASLVAVDEGIEGADDVVAIDAEVEGEVVPRTCRNADVGKTMLGGDRGHYGLRPITARHAEGVCAAVPYRSSRQRREIVAWFEHDRLDVSRPALRDEVESSHLPPPSVD